MSSQRDLWCSYCINTQILASNKLLKKQTCLQVNSTSDKKLLPMEVLRDTRRVIHPLHSQHQHHETGFLSSAQRGNETGTEEIRRKCLSGDKRQEKAS